MYNPEQQQQQGHQQLMAPPRMSFSSDFALEPPPTLPPSGLGRASMGDADFEFSSVGVRPMMAADQLFSKGRILPLREAPGGGGGGRPVTLRDELRGYEAAANGDRHRCAVRPVASGARWKELLGLKRAHRKKADAVDSAGEGASSHDHDHVDVGDHGGE
ncbi:hypothetical protein GUJ93_ZPchr0008g13845 [Zizania palustris]|uniref:Uncharacterized protein n=1 Tax=Zizania palustris TaxID=103762 RepID=A0A8J5V1W9_ZIZPA|nr:hypothetical protein GUJ93_ZPchr0008g13845 [Zizania palustris]